MKAWNGYGSEHSCALVLVGTFKTEHEAETTCDLLNKLVEQASQEDLFAINDGGPEHHRFSDGMRKLLKSEEIYVVAPTELEQFSYNAHLVQKGKTVRLTTDESDVSAFAKVIVKRHGRVDIRSAHDFPDDTDE